MDVMQVGIFFFPNVVYLLSMCSFSMENDINMSCLEVHVFSIRNCKEHMPW